MGAMLIQRYLRGETSFREREKKQQHCDTEQMGSERESNNMGRIGFQTAHWSFVERERERGTRE